MTSRKRSPTTWILWLAVVIAMLGLATLAFSRYRMWQVKAEVESLGGRLHGEELPPRWFEWLVNHTPDGRPRQIVAGFRKQFQRVTVIQLLGANPQRGLLHRLTCFQFLKQLNLSGCQIHDDDLTALARFPQLNTLVLADNPLTDAAAIHFQKLEPLSLVVVSLDGTGIGNDTMTALSRIDSLGVISVSDSLVSDAGLTGFRDLNLTRLELTRTKITDATLFQLGHQPELVDLGLNGTNVTNFGLSALTGARFPELRELGVYETKVTAHGITALRLSLLNRLKFTCPMSAADWRKLATMRKLYRVLWRENHVMRRHVRFGTRILGIGPFVMFDRSGRPIELGAE